MANSSINDNLSMKTLQSFLPFATILVSIALSWGSLSSQIALLNQKTDGIIEVAKNAESKVNNLADRQQDMALQLEKLSTIIESAQQRGQLSQSSQSTRSNSITSQATPQPSTNRSSEETQPNQVVYNTTTNQSVVDEKKNEDQPSPTSNPSPSPQPSAVGELLGNIIPDLLF